MRARRHSRSKLILAGLLLAGVAGCSFIFPFDGLQGDLPGDAAADAALDQGAPARDAAADGSADACTDAGMCNGACVALDHDPSNCGACGNTCKGTTCAGSVCTPLEVASGNFSSQGIVVDGAGVYWLAQAASGKSSVYRVALASLESGSPDASVAPELLQQANAAWSLLAANDSTLFWGEMQGAGTAIRGMAKDGGLDADVPSFVRGGKRIGAFAVDQTNVYYAQFITSIADAVLRSPLSLSSDGGTELYPPGSDAGTAFVLGNLVVDGLIGGPQLFLSLGKAPAQILRIDDVTSMDAGDWVVSSVSDDGYAAVGAIAVTPSRVVWTVTPQTGSKSGVLTIAREAGAGARSIADVIPGEVFGDVAADETTVYWVGAGTGTNPTVIRRVGIDGGTNVVVASPASADISLAITPSWLLWTAGGNLYALARAL